MADGGRHTANLAVSAFAKNQAKPRRGHILAEPDRHGPGPEAGRFLNEFDIDRFAWSVRQMDPATKCVERFFGWNPFDLGEISFRMVVARVGQAVREGAIVGDEKQALAVEVKAADRVNSGDLDVISQSRSALGVRKPGEDA